MQVGKKVLKTLQQHAKVQCGYAGVNDVRTGHHEDRMDSYVLSETFKYLFLLFADDSELLLNLDEFVFTTEAHLLPLTLGDLGGSSSNESKGGSNSKFDDDQYPATNFNRQCPSPNKLFPTNVRRPIRELVTGTCPRVSATGTTNTNQRRLRAQDFQASNADHLRTVYEMGITMVQLGDKKVQLLHNIYDVSEWHLMGMNNFIYQLITLNF